jgi:3-oxoacyl-[acyl-carrier protein] reductase
MKSLLQDKIAIITGGTAGIGKAIALKFAAEGASVVIFGRNEERGCQVVEEINTHTTNQKATFHKVDISNVQETSMVISDIIKEKGKVDILVNNAGVTRDNLLMKMTEDDWDTVINTNLKSVYTTCKAVVRSMMKSRKGKIINISSVVGLVGGPGQMNYAASKSGLLGMTKSLAKELASRNVCVNSIAPGFIQTSMTDSLNEKQTETILSQIPMGRMGRSEEIANTALFLASELADYITGQCLTVDGGMVMS